ncbi:MAG: hypothetical protein ACRDL2_06640 [Gaiellaceae bacterium]
MRVLGVSLALVLIVVPSAAGKRAPTQAERSAVGGSVKGFVATPGSPAAKDDRIAATAVSTLDPRYAGVRLTSKNAGPSEMVLHLSRGTWFVVGFGSSLGCDSAPKAVLADLGIGCSPPSTTAWIWNCGPYVSAPATFVITCADANYELTKLRWRGWGSARATAAGTAQANDCTPYCAAGHFHSYRMAAVADRLESCGKARVYARLTITYSASRPKGIAKRDVQTLGC